MRAHASPPAARHPIHAGAAVLAAAARESLAMDRGSFTFRGVRFVPRGPTECR